jgi:hypothetical protein
MRPSLFRSLGVSLLLLTIAGCGDDGGKATRDGGAGHTGGNGAAGGKGGGAGQGAVAGGAGQGATAGAAGAGTTGGAGGSPKDGGATDGSGLDLGGITPPSMLTATVLDRRATTFELVWTAPSNNGAAVTGYQVRYAKVPITATNFDDTTVTTAVTYTGTPKAPGATDGIIVKAYIENGYYFAVTGTDGANAHVGAFMATATAVTAHFNVSLIASPSGTNQSFGATLDGSRDVNGDGVSDLLVATYNDNHAYLFFGGSTFGPSAPSVVFTGTNIGFGATVGEIGDIDGDGLQDVAIADWPTGLRVLIYKGRLNWPMTLTDGQADYVITTDATYAGSAFGYAMNGLGDFDGDGIDDFAISAPLFNSRQGRAAVVYGRSGFTSFTVANTTRALEIGADPALTKTQFGIALLGLGHFYSVTSGTTLVVSAPGLGAQPSDNAGRLYAFHGRGPGAPIDVTTADDARVGPAVGALIGNELANLGPVTNALPSVGSSNLSDAVTVSGTTGTAFALSGAAATGPLANSITVYRSGTSFSGEAFFGGGFSGLDTFVSLIGDAKSDIALSGRQNSTLDIIDGSKLASLASPIDTLTSANVHVPMPSGWTSTADGSRALIKDINKDGYPDFALGDVVLSSSPGRVAVFW